MNLRLLLIADREEDGALYLEPLVQAGYDVQLRRVEAKEGLESALECQTWDLIFCDSSLESLRAEEALHLLQERDYEIPLIVVSETLGEEAAGEFMALGARDFLAKSNLVRFVPVVQRELRAAGLRRCDRSPRGVMVDQEEQLRTAFEQAPIGIAHLARDGRCLRANPWLCTLTGYTESQLRGVNFFQLVHPEERQASESEFGRIAGGEFAAGRRVKRLLRSDGTARWVGVTASTVHDSGGGIAHVLLTIDDVTERKLASDEAKGHNSLLRSTLESTADGILVVGRDGRIVAFNRRFVDLWQVPHEVIAGRDDERALAHMLNQITSPDAFLEKVRHLYSHPREASLDLIHFVDGRIFERYSSPQLLDNEPVGRVWSFRDVTAQRRAEAALRESHQQYETLVNSLEGIVFEFDLRQQRFTFVSPQAERLLGYPLSAWSQPNFWQDHLHPDDRTWAIDYCLGETMKLKAHTFEYRMIAADGRVVWVRDIISVEAEGQQPIKLRGFLADITARKQLEESYRNIIEFAPIGFAQTTPEGRILSANSKLAEILGYDSVADFMTGRSAADLYFHPQDREAQVSKYLDSDVTSSEFLLRKNDGSPAYALLKERTVRRGDDVVFESFCSDISDLKRASEALRASEEYFRSLIENASDMISLLSPDGSSHYNSPSVERVLGYTPAELQGNSFFEFIHAEDSCEVLGALSRCAIEPESVVTIRLRYRHKNNGTWRTLESVAKNLLHNPVVRAIVLNSRDVTETETLQRQLERERRLSSLGHLAASIAHEFNNVMMGIQPFAEQLARKSDPDFQRAVGHIGNCVKRGKRVTEEILRFTRTPEPILKTVPAHPWIEEVIAQVQPLFGPEIHFTYECGRELAFIGDSSQLSQVMVNLLLNARDAMVDGGRLTLNIQPATHNDHLAGGDPRNFVHISLSDTGCGMSRETMLRIFEPFFTTKRSGTGLGLAIVHQAVKAHKGQVWVESEEGKGTTFHLLLARAPRSAESPSDPSKTAGTNQVRGKTIVVVEDDQIVAEGIAAMLISEEARVEIVNEGQKAVAAIGALNPDAVLLDLSLPDMSGEAVYAAIADRWPDLPVIFSTGHGDRSKLATALSHPNVRFLQKPYDSRTLLEELVAIA